MKINIVEHQDGIAILEIAGSITKVTYLQALRDTIQKLINQGRDGILLDLSGCKRINMAGIAALVELPGRLEGAFIAFCSLPNVIDRKLKSIGLDQGLRIFGSRTEALGHFGFRQRCLNSTKAIVICAQEPAGAEQIQFGSPNACLDMLGRPLIGRVFDHLKSYGIADIYVQTGPLADQLIDICQTTSQHQKGVFFRRLEPSSVGQRSAATIKQFSNENGGFSKDIIVGFGEVLTDVNLSKMMEFHRSSGADLTHFTKERDVSVPAKIRSISTPVISEPETRGRVHPPSKGVWILSRSVFDFIPDTANWSMRDLAHALQSAGGKIRCYRSNGQLLSVNSSASYFAALSGLVQGDFSDVHLEGESMRNGQWIVQTEERASEIQLYGKGFIGNGARLGPGVECRGLTVIQAGARVGKNSVLENCIVLPDAEIEQGFWGQNLIIGRERHVDYRFKGQKLDHFVPRRDKATAARFEDIRASA